MDRARSDAVPDAFLSVFGRDSGYTLKVLPPFNDPIVAGPISRTEYQIYRGRERVAEIYQNGHIECLDESIRPKLDAISEILEKAAAEAYDQVMAMDS